MIRKIFLFSLIYIFHCSYAYAYLDPGTGSVILTAIVTALAAGLATINSFKIKLKKITNKIFFKKDTLTKDNKKKTKPYCYAVFAGRYNHLIQEYYCPKN